MIPMILASVAGSLVSGLFHSRREAPAPSKTSEPADFENQFNSQVKNPATETQSIQSLIAIQKSHGLSLDQQIALAQRLLNQTIQVLDSAGNSFVGRAENITLSQGGIHLLVGGRSYPLTAVQAVIDGIPGKP